MHPSVDASVGRAARVGCTGWVAPVEMRRFVQRKLTDAPVGRRTSRSSRGARRQRSRSGGYAARSAYAVPGTEVDYAGTKLVQQCPRPARCLVVMLAQIANEVRTPIGRYARAMQRPVLTQQTAYALARECPSRSNTISVQRALGMRLLRPDFAVSPCVMRSVMHLASDTAVLVA
eukprot:2820900-Rhodomonas_salina.3